MKVYIAKIMEMQPSTLDEGDSQKIIDGYVKLCINNKTVWAMTDETWRSGAWTLTMTGKKISIALKFLNLESKLTSKSTFGFFPVKDQKKPCDHIAVGKIISKEIKENYIDYEVLYVDCGGIVVSMSTKKNEFNIGDIIEADGRLDIYRIKVSASKL